MAALRNRKMDCILNFVYDVWDEEKNEPKPNRLKTYNHKDDIEGTTWRISTDPMKVFANVKINNRRIEDVEKYPGEVFFYHVWNINCFNNRFFANNILPVDLDVIEKVKKYDNLYLIIMNECEFEKKQGLERLTNIVRSLKIEQRKVWYIHNNEKLLEHKIELESEINVHTTRSMSTALKYGQKVEFIENKEPGSFFLCMNRSPRIHRYAILCLLKKYNILDDTNWSLVCGWDFNDRKYLFKDVFNFDDVLNLNDEISYFTSLDIKKGKYEIDYSGLDNRNAQDLPNEPKTFENSYFKKITDQFIAPVTRVRLTKLPPKKDLLFHVDYDPSYAVRVVVPIYTNKHVKNLFRWNGKEENYFLEHGKAYFLNTGIEHAVVNESNEPRIALIFSLDGQADIQKFKNV